MSSCCRRCCGISVLAAFGSVSLVVRACTGVALALCGYNPGSNHQHENQTLSFYDPGSETSPFYNHLDEVVTSPVARVVVLVGIPILLYPLSGLFVQLGCCSSAKKCDHLSFVQVCSLLPASLIETVLVATSPCLFTRNALVVTHVVSCLVCVGIFLGMTCMIHWRRSRVNHNFGNSNDFETSLLA